MVGMILTMFCGQGGPIVMFSIFIMNWLRSFNVENFEGGPLKNENEVYHLY